MKKHFTATAYIVAKIDGRHKLLLHKHKKHKLWLAVGGHIEKDENPTEALLREVKEETNLEITILKGKLLRIDDVEELACPVAILQERLAPYKQSLKTKSSSGAFKLVYKNEPAHYHIDLIYFAICKNPDKIKMKEQYAWFSRRDLKKLNLEKEVEYLIRKLFNYV